MATRPNIANRLSRAGLIGGLALASVSPVTQAQSIDSVYLPAVYHGPTSVYGQPQGLTHLASQPSLQPHVPANL